MLSSSSSAQRFTRLLTVAGALIMLAGCETYKPLPLSDESPLLNDVIELPLEATGLAADNTRETRQISLTDGLYLTEIGIVAVINNPELKARRASLNVANAQAFSAGLLPDLLRGGIEKGEALVRAGRNRLRPIVMTTLAAVFALLPLALAPGQGSARQQPLAVAIIAGLLVQIPLVVVVIPVLYKTLTRISV